MYPPTFKNRLEDEDREIYIDVNGYKHTLQIFFVNKKGFFRIQKNSFIQLEFNDSIYNPFMSFTLVLKNDYNEIESNSFTSPDSNFEDLHYEFLGNSDELVLIKLQPQNIAEDEYEVEQEHYYRIEKQCFIYDEDQVEEEGSVSKVFELMDIKYRELRFPTKPWSTNNLLNGDVTQLSDKDREVYTGDALKNLLKTFTTEGNINEEKWDRGNSKIFYSSLVDTTPLEALQYIIDNHISTEDNSPCLLREDKFGVLNFIPIKKMYEGIIKENLAMGPEIVGNYQLPVNGYTDVKDSENAPIVNSLVTNFQINRYSYLNFSAVNTVERLKSINVVKYNFKDKKYNIYRNEGDIDNTIDYINKNYLTNLPGESNLVNLTPGDMVKSKNTIRTFYNTSQTQDVAVYDGRNELIKNVLFLSNNLEFESVGNLNLKSGKFVNIVREAGITTNFEKKLQGYYLIIDTNHIVTNSKYITNVVAVKPYIS